MSHWQSGDVVANGIRIHYTRTGGARPPLVLAHGVTDDGLCWSPLAAALAPSYDVVMADARGHGRSAAPAGGYDPATQAADLAGLIAALGLRKPALLGHSMGAVSALVLAGMFPDVPGALLLEDPPGWWALAAEPAGDTPSAPFAWFDALKHKTRAELIAEERLASPGWSEAELGPWADAKLLVSDHVRAVFGSGTPHTVDWPEVLGRVSCPALLITADISRGAALDEGGAAALRARVPHLQIAHIAGAGHSIRRDQFERYAEVVRAFLAAHMPAGGQPAASAR